MRDHSTARRGEHLGRIGDAADQDMRLGIPGSIGIAKPVPAIREAGRITPECGATICTAESTGNVLAGVPGLQQSDLSWCDGE
jgi:hypothetical protein